MTLCSACYHKNMPGAIFCTECGTPLVNDDTLATRDINDGTRPRQLTDVPTERIRGWVTLHILPSGQLIPLSDRNEFTLGRTSDNQPVIPDVDLGPYQAYTLGVSRLHAQIKRQQTGVITIMDLNSSNGTYLNGKKLPPQEAVPLSHGDVVALGKLKIQILIA